MGYGLDDQTEAWIAEQIEKLPHEELGKAAAEVQGLGAGLICPDPKCSPMAGRIFCTPVALPGSPVRYVFFCAECLVASDPKDTPEAARAVFLKSSRERAWNDNGRREPRA
jgi:hypothetical protein